MADIVERLRQSGGGVDFPWKAMREAAAEIERLRAALEQIAAVPSRDYMDGPDIARAALEP